MKRILLLCVMAFTLPGWLPAQQRTVSGTVTSYEDGGPLPGVNVQVRGTTEGTTTSVDGSYRLTVPSDEAVLVFSFIGMVSEEVPVQGRSTLNVEMMPDIQQLSEVVVVGYGTTSRKLLSGSIAKVEAKELDKAIAPGMDAALQGKVPGVQVFQNSGTPGGAISVLVRGKASINGGTQPLYVIDGVPMTTGDFSQISYEGQGINAITDLNPADIESVEVLKDASAAAIYGARASNGVVLITTKSGKAGKSKITLDSYYGVQQLYKKLDLLGAGEFMQYANDFREATGKSPIYSQEQIDNPDVDTDWQDEIFRTASVSNVKLGISGGNDHTTYYVSGSYFDQEGIVLGTNYERLTGRLNLNHALSDKVTMGLKTSVGYTMNNRVPGDQTIDGVLPNAISKPSVYGVYDDNGSYLEEGFWPNPVAIGTEAINEAEGFRNISNLFAEWEITEGLTFKNQWGIDWYELNERQYEGTLIRRGARTNGFGVSATSRSATVLQQSTLAWEKALSDKQSLSLLAGFSFEKTHEKSNYIAGSNFPSDALEYLQSAGNIESASSSQFERGLGSLFGRANYVYDDKYIVTFNIRRDRSTNFGGNNQYGTFPGLALAWNISEEDFLSSTQWLSQLKLRLSYGLTGNDRIGSFRYLTLYSSGFNYADQPGIVPTQIPNPDLKWETTRQTNVGVDLGLWDRRLTLIADAYYNKTVDLLIDRPLPGSVGFTTVSANVGELENKGVEFGLNADLVRGSDLTWTAGVNMSFNRNKVLTLYNGQPITNIGRGQNAVIEGEPLGVFYMFESLGVDPSTGELVFRDVNNDGRVTDADRTIVGNPNPDFTGGFTTALTYKGFDAALLLQFSYGNDIFNGVRRYSEAMGSLNDNQLASIQNRWREPGDRAPVPRINGDNNFTASSYFVEDGSFLRARNLTIGYTLPGEMTRQWGVTKLRLYTNIQNLFTVTDYSGYDPEVNYSGIGAVSAGTDFFTFPQPRTYVLGLNLSF